MPTYTVHAPPPPNGNTATDRFVFVRDGFHFWAFVAPAIWLLVYRLWLAFAGYAILTLALVAGLRLIAVSTAGIVAATVCIMLLMGLEAASLRRWTLARRDWTMLGFVVADDEDEAEQRFFLRWAERPEPAPAAPIAPSASIRRTPPGVIGLFPEPGSAR